MKMHKGVLRMKKSLKLMKDLWTVDNKNLWILLQKAMKWKKKILNNLMQKQSEKKQYACTMLTNDK